MLTNLQIENVALIENAVINFQSGLNILSGETGAGKSMIIDSLHFAMGERVSRDFLRQGEKSAQVSALFFVEETDITDKLLENGITIEEDGAVLLQRIINTSGKNICRINGRVVTIGMLKAVAEGLVDIHGQHAHRSLLNPSRHILLLDRFCQREFGDLLQCYLNAYNEFLDKDREYKKILTADGGENDLEFLQFQVDEINQAALSEEEEEKLLKQRQMLLNSEKLQRLTAESLTILYDGTERTPGASDMLAEASNRLYSLADTDDSINNLCEAMDSITAQLDDCIRQIRRYGEAIESDGNLLEQVEQRLQLIYHLKQKYGASIPNVLEYCRKATERINNILNKEERLLQAKKSRTQAYKKAEALADKMSAVRINTAKVLSNEIETQLRDLEMKNAIFQISITQKEELTASGRDAVEFLISPNKGEDLKPLAKIASGGEMSRVMLALKTILAEADTIDTFIFDEIDTGVSGRTAQKVAEKMSVMGKTHQIISVTHLPQIAAMADAHFMIEKTTQEQKTVTSVIQLSDAAQVQELARLIGGTTITDATMLAAQDLKNQAIQLKQSKCC